MESEEEHGAHNRVQVTIHKWVPAKYVHAAEHYGHVVYLGMVAAFAHGPYDVVAGGLAVLIVLSGLAGYGEEA